MKPLIRPKSNAGLYPLIWTALLTGCAAVPPYVAPTLSSATGFTAGRGFVETASSDVRYGTVQRVVEAEVDAQWWRLLRSPALDDLVTEALRNSPTLAAAQSALVQAREMVSAQSGSTQLPQVELGLGTQRQQISPSAQGLPGDAREFSLYSASVGVRYRFDFGGGTDSNLRALAARADVKQHELSAAHHALAANIASNAIARARLADQIEAQSAILNIQNEMIRIAEVRTRLGQAAPEEVSALTVQAELTRSGIPLLRKQMQQIEHSLAVLAGRQPSTGVPAFTLADFTLPEELPVSVPSEWARHRPDILAAEAALRAAHGDLGATYARQYPQLNLSANLGSQALTTSALFGGAAAVWSIAGQLSQPLFNAGLPAERRAAQAAFDAAAANYQRVVLEALRTVANALTAVEHDAESLASLTRSLHAAEQQHHVLERQHKAGVSSAVQLLVADQMLLQARSGLIAAQAQRLLNTVALSASLVGKDLEPQIQAAR